MTKKKSNIQNQFPGFSDVDSQPIKIKSVKKDKKGFLIELKSSREKEKDTVYTYAQVEGVYQIFKNNNPVLTPGGSHVTSESETIIKEVVNYMNKNGEQYEDATSIVSFLYSEIDFFKDRTRESLAEDIFYELQNIDWTLHSPYYGVKNDVLWTKYLGHSETREEEVINWVKSLNKHQTEGVYIMTANISSPNIAFILSNKFTIKELPMFTKLCQEKYSLHRKKEGKGMYSFWPYEQLLQIFKNYLFWQKSKN